MHHGPKLNWDQNKSLILISLFSVYIILAIQYERGSTCRVGSDVQVGGTMHRKKKVRRLPFYFGP